MFSEIENDECYKLMVLLAIEFPSENVKEDAKAILNRININRLYECALEHDMESVIYPGLVELTNGQLPEFWREKYLKRKVRIEYLIQKLEEVAEKLDSEGIPIVALKNGGIAAGMIPDKAKCPMGDIDTLVCKENFIKSHNIISEMGFILRFRSAYEEESLMQAFINGGTEYFLKGFNENPEGMWLEMSWRPIAGRWIRVDKEPKAEELMGRASYIQNSKIRLLSPEDNLLQVAIHTAKHSYVREPGFRLHLDVDRIVKHSNIDWDLFLKRVEDTGTKTAVFYSLDIARQLFHTPIPEHILSKLRPNRLKNWMIKGLLAKAGLLHPTSKKFAKSEFILFQSLLYDSTVDIFKVIMPSVNWLKDKYRFDSMILVPYYIIIRILDLAGIRKSKRE